MCWFCATSKYKCVTCFTEGQQEGRDSQTHRYSCSLDLKVKAELKTIMQCTDSEKSINAIMGY